MSDRSTFFVDRSLGKGVGRILRGAGAIVELHDDHFPQNAPDRDWIPVVTNRGWIILTKDKNIRRPRGEREDVLLASAKIFTLTSGNMPGVVMARTFLDHLPEMERVALTQTPPFVYAVGPDIFLQILPPPVEDSDPDDSDADEL